MTVLEKVRSFSKNHGKTQVVNATAWRYYSLGSGAPILWLTGGLRRAALGYAFMQRLADTHTVIAIDYPPVMMIGEFLAAFDAILQAEGVETFALGGQSYGGLLAQAYLAYRPTAVRHLILSSTGPADYGKAWLPVEYIAIGLVRLLPERNVKNLLAGGLFKIMTLPDDQRSEWQQAVNYFLHEELSREDVVSHFAVAADLIRRGIVSPGAYKDWYGRVTVLSAENDPTQNKRDIPHYEKLFGRSVEVVSMGELGHTAALIDPERYVAMLEIALD